MSISARHLVRAPAVWVWLGLAALVVAIPEIEWSQDLRSYEDNIIRLYINYEISEQDSKSIWYSYYLNNIFYITSSVETTIYLVKANIITLLLFSYRNVIQNNVDALITIVMLGVAPVVSENIHEYLRQGLAIGVFLMAMSYSRLPIRWSFIIVAYAVHQAILFVGLAVLVGYAFHRIGFNDEGRAKGSAIIAVQFALALSAMLALGGSGLPFMSVVSGFFGFLSGSRDNTLGALFLFAYSAYLAYLALSHGSKMHCAAFAGMLIICSFYTLILDFGRSVSMVMPLHIAAALSMGEPRTRYLDLLAILAAGLVVVLF